MNIVSYGGGTNSTALLIECVNRSIPIDLILFADTGGEKPHTYIYLKLFSKWCVENGLPKIITVQTQNIFGTFITLEQKCLDLKQLPSKAYGNKSCSEKHKIRPQNKFINNWSPAKEVWGKGEKIIKFVGYDAGEDHRTKNYDDNKYIVKYPLVEWDMDRDGCIKTIESAELPLPGKSACFFCPSSKPHEIRQLAREYPNLIERAKRIESVSTEGSTKTVLGLGRSFSWTNLLNQNDMFDCDIRTLNQCDDCYDG